MGTNFYCYFTAYQADIQATLDALREAERIAGRYEPCFHSKTGKYLFEFGLTPRQTFPAPGACHVSLDEVYNALDEGGSNSIIDIVRATDTPFLSGVDPMTAPDMFERFNTTAPLSNDDLKSVLGGP